MDAGKIQNPPDYNEAMATTNPGHVMATEPAIYNPPTSYPAIYNTHAHLPGPNVITQQPPQVVVVSVTPQQTRSPCLVHCQQCNKTVTTEVTMVTSMYTHLFCCLICFFTGAIFCLWLIPYFTNFSKDAVHRCPECKMHLGTCKASV